MKKYAPWLIVICLAAGWLTDRNLNPPAAAQEEKTWEAFEISELIERRRKAGRPYLPFLKRETMRLGIYSLPKGAIDIQPAHRMDEVYYVESGRAVLQIGRDEQKVEKGSLIFVRRDQPHKFHSITEPLEVLVFFSAAGAGK